MLSSTETETMPGSVWRKVCKLCLLSGIFVKNFPTFETSFNFGSCYYFLYCLKLFSKGFKHLLSILFFVCTDRLDKERGQVYTDNSTPSRDAKQQNLIDTERTQTMDVTH